MRYHQLSVLSVLAAAPLANFATPHATLWDDIRVKHTWNDVPSNWETLGHPPAGTTIDLHVALQPHNENALINALYQVSTPKSPKHVLSNTPPRTMHLCVPLLRCRYGAHLSKEEVAKLVEPHPDTLKLVHSWLAHHGVQSSSISTTHGGGWLTVTGVPISQANELLGASYQLYRYVGTNDTILRTVGYALPTVLHAHVQTVAPTTFFASTRTLQQAPHRHSVGAAGAPAKAESREPVTVLSSRDESEPPSDADGVTPEFLRRLYKTFDYVPAATGKNSLGIAGHNNEFPSRTDLTVFMTVLRTDAVDAIFTVEPVNGGEYDSSRPGTEANLDMQYAQAMGYPTPHIFYSIGGQILWFDRSGAPAPGDLFVSWLAYLLRQRKIPQTITTSYGANEKVLPPEYARSVCRLFAQLGARGVSVLFSSGDNGVGTGECEVESDKVEFIPRFPATCMCGVWSFLARSTRTQAQVAYHIATLSQVPMSLPSAARRNHPRSRRSSPGAASRTIFRALTTRTKLCLNSSGVSATCITACTSAFSSVTRPDLFLLCNFVICVALPAAEFLTSQRKRSSTSPSSTPIPFP